MNAADAALNMLLLAILDTASLTPEARTAFIYVTSINMSARWLARLDSLRQTSDAHHSERHLW